MIRRAGTAAAIAVMLFGVLGGAKGCGSTVAGNDNGPVIVEVGHTVIGTRADLPPGHYKRIGTRNGEPLWRRVR